MLSYFLCVVLEVLLMLVFVFSFREAEVLKGHGEYWHVWWNRPIHHAYVLGCSDRVLLGCEKDPRLTLGSFDVSGYWEMRSIAIDSGSSEVKASGAVPSFILRLMCP
jgi:hypothetical protein